MRAKQNCNHRRQPCTRNCHWN